MNLLKPILSSTSGRVLRLRSMSTTNKYKTGIIMLNMGGPRTTDGVYDYLHKIMTDQDMIQFPFMQDRLGTWIAKRRTPEVQEKYREIGGGSPILDWTRKQGELMCRKLDATSPESGPHKYYVAFRYVPPFTNEAFEEMERDGVERAVIFSQYPQYSCATSGSSLNEIYKYYRKKGAPSGVVFSVIERWGGNALLAKTFADLIRKELEQFPAQKRNDVIILFSAHSLPLKTVTRGDSYPYEVGTTVQNVMSELNHSNPHHLVWQSKVGPLPWLGPFTDDALRSYAKTGKKSFVLVPIAFVNEHIETLHEMDIEYCKDLGKEIGAEIRRCPAPNVHPLFIEALAGTVASHLRSGVRVSQKFLHRCPHCTNATCYNSKKWYGEVCSK